MRLSFISSAVLFLAIAVIRAQEEEGAGSDITWDETTEQSDNSGDFATPNTSEEAQENPADDTGNEADWASLEDDAAPAETPATTTTPTSVPTTPPHRSLHVGSVMTGSSPVIHSSAGASSASSASSSKASFTVPPWAVAAAAENGVLELGPNAMAMAGVMGGIFGAMLL